MLLPASGAKLRGPCGAGCRLPDTSWQKSPSERSFESVCANEPRHERIQKRALPCAPSYPHQERRHGIEMKRVSPTRFVSPAVSSIRAILFDCDGVLCPPMRFADLLEREYKITRDMTANFFKVAFLPALLGRVDVITLLPPYLKQWGWKKSTEEFLDMWLSSEREVRAPVIEIISDLRKRGYFVGAATNQESRRAEYLRTEMGFEELFDRCFISSELGHMKPQREYFHSVTSELGVAPQQIIFLDDQQSYLNAAKECGWRTILFTAEDTAREELAKVLEDSAQTASKPAS